MSITDILNQSVGGYSLGHILTAGVTLVICLLIIRVIMHLLERILSRTNLERRIQKYICSAAKILMYILTVVIVAQGLGVNMTSFVALLSVLSLGVTLAMEDILANFAGGLVIMTSHPFAITDAVESAGTVGTVEEIDLFHTKLLTPDGHYVLIPNKDLAASRIINYTSLGRRRVTVKITASYDAPTEEVFAACQDALDSTENILENPASAIWLTNYGESSIEYTIFCWALPANYWSVLCNLNRNLRPAFAAHNVEMTYDHLNVHIVENKA